MSIEHVNTLTRQNSAMYSNVGCYLSEILGTKQNWAQKVHLHS